MTRIWLRAFQDLFRREILWHVLWPPLSALLVWSAIAMVAWLPASEWIRCRLPEWNWLDWLGAWLAHAAVFLIFAPMIYLTALLLTAMFALPRMMTLIANRDYPDLERSGPPGAATWGSMNNTLGAIALFILGWLCTFPLLLLPGAVFILPLIWTAWLNQRTFRFDALAEHATQVERKRLFVEHRLDFYLTGLVAAAATHVPLINLLAPGFAALSFIHLGLSILRTDRAKSTNTALG